jgi:hypothetical protein
MGGGDKLQRVSYTGGYLFFVRLEWDSFRIFGLLLASQFLDLLLPKEILQQDKAATTLIQLGGEELFRYSKSYQDLLAAQVSQVVTDFRGSLQDAPDYKGRYRISVLRYYLKREKYLLPNADELDVRLNKQLIQPLQESRFLQESEKRDADVLKIIVGK